jgi:hypothetical protein
MPKFEEFAKNARGLPPPSSDACRYGKADILSLQMALGITPRHNYLYGIRGQGH